MDKIRLLFVDCDGTLTNGHYHVSSDGVTTKGYHTRDFFALKKIQKLGYRVVILTGAKDGSVDMKCQQSRLECISDAQDKVAVAEAFMAKYGYEWGEVAFFGDAENDMRAMDRAGFTACPNDALPEVKDRSNYISDFKGGEAAVYDIIRYLYKLQGESWFTEDELG
jgi:3-deoxy-D-manno-octulosonate 8-phosphate phosphatase (KDO 8-P phosphatase)